VDRRRNKVVAFELSKNSDQNDGAVCRKLINQIVNFNSLDTIATDGNYNYGKFITTRNQIITDKNSGEKSIILRDCNKHIISKSETSSVECFNASLRGRFARFSRRTKAYSKSLNSAYNAVFLWVNRDLLLKNIKRYAGFGL
jgi:IS1 family transposase